MQIGKLNFTKLKAFSQFECWVCRDNPLGVPIELHPALGSGKDWMLFMGDSWSLMDESDLRILFA